MEALYHESAYGCSTLVTKLYSTSFTLGIKTLQKKFHQPIYAVYGFVRYADEIVDTFLDKDRKYLLDKFKADTYEAIEMGISMNPIIHAYQQVVNQYGIENELTEAFFNSMETDLYQDEHNRMSFDEYIYGSAEVVGLMCLRVFVEGDRELFKQLKPGAKRLGAAFQKVNFLRDMKSDFEERGRSYFPDVDFSMFSDENKRRIEAEIEEDFDEAYKAILQLPKGARLGVYLAYRYYRKLFNKIKSRPAIELQQQRIRVPNLQKFAILLNTWLRNYANTI